MSTPASPALTADQAALVEVVRTLKIQANAEVRLSWVGLLGIGLLGTSAWLFWRRR